MSPLDEGAEPETQVADLPGPAGAGLVLRMSGTDHSARWRPGMRLEALFERRCDALRAAGHSGRRAVDGDRSLTYDQLDQRSNRLARHLMGRGVSPGDRVALLFDDPVHAYAAILGTLKAGAAFVPLDPAFPEDRIAYILEDAGVGLVLTLSHLRARLPDTGVRVVCLDEDDRAIAAADRTRPGPRETADDALAYIIYTSGSTGRPKGVAVDHSSICNFVLVAAENYGYVPGDRVYQGMTIAFDFSVEELWVPWMVGATLVPKPAGQALLGADLCRFLIERGVTAMCCVPTLLATLDEDLPNLRFLLVSGEACPKDLVVRWHKPGRRFLNVYGPTEATVTATWDEVHPDKPVTLGVPLPTYAVVVLDPDTPRALPHGETGEIGIAGIGLARGYVNRDEQTRKAFIPDFLELEHNPSGRIYRTGDLGRVTPAGTLEYLGRIDTQVKVRGYRIELSEIESVVLEFPGIALAVVSTHEPVPGVVELAAYYTLRSDTESIDADALADSLREKLPSYMVPAYLERCDGIPLMPSGKVDRKRLPTPTSRHKPRNPAGGAVARTRTEESLAQELGAALGLETVPVDAHFFDVLGANSLLMAHFAARVRRNSSVPRPAMQDIYQHPTIRGLAAVLEARRDAEQPTTESAALPAPASAGPSAAPSTVRYVLCGLAQLAAFLAYTTGAAFLLVLSYEWVSAGANVWEAWARSVALGGIMFVGLSAVPIILKWVLIGRWREREFPVWGWTYFRFWLVRLLTRLNPLALFAGSPLFVLYLRLLGAKVGRNCAVFTRIVPACPDLVSIGDGTVIHKSSAILGYRVRDGVVQTGRVTIGNNALVSQKTVLDIGTAMGDGSELGHASSLQSGQAVPAGQSWHGSPAVRTHTQYRRLRPRRVTLARKVLFTLLQVLNRFVFVVPGAALLLSILLPGYLSLGHFDIGSHGFHLDALFASVALFITALVAGLAAVLTLPRILHAMTRAEHTYPLYGFHYTVHRTVEALTAAMPYKVLFGDSSYIVHFLKALGWKLGRNVEQTGSNFGPGTIADNPYLSHVGFGTMVSDGLVMMNQDYTNTSFRSSHVHIAAHNYLGNDISVPIGSRAGENCLLGTKVGIPIDGPLRKDTGLLGSPAFEIPRTVERDRQFDDLKTGTVKNERLHRKNRHNLATMGLYLAVGWFTLYVGTVLAAVSAALYGVLGAFSIALGTLAFLVFRVLFGAFTERAALRFGRLSPRYCSIYDRYFWQHERLWKMLGAAPFAGTPFKGLLWRLYGVRVGKRLFDNGATIVEKTLVGIGDDCTLNEGAIIQCHSLEDGVFKSDHIAFGNHCTVGVQAFIHYGTILRDGAVVEADSFLMKGEDVPEGTRYGGNPAREHPATAAAPPAAAGRRGI